MIYGTSSIHGVYEATFTSLGAPALYIYYTPQVKSE